jgi:DinB family protein
VNTTARSGSPLDPAPLPPPDCRSCGFTSGLVRWDTTADVLQGYAEEWQRLLRAPGLSDRPTGAPFWSPLESGCHVRDMCLLFPTRLDAILGKSMIAPRSSAAADTAVDAAPDPTAGDGRRYRDEEPRQVAEELGRAAEALARRLAALSADDWDRDDPRLADPRLTLGFLTRHLLHDIAHHLAAHHPIAHRPAAHPR